MTRFTKRRVMMTCAPVFALGAALPGSSAPPASTKTIEFDQASISEFNAAIAAGMPIAAARLAGRCAG